MRTRLKVFFAALMGLVLSACSPAMLLNTLLVPSNGYTIKRDIAYGTDPRQKLDIYIPDHMNGPAPVLLFIYGGSWDSGSKDIYKFLGQAFASKGIVTVVADYRLYPQVKYPAFIEDSAHAFKFVHDNIATYGGDPKRLFLSGHSAGAYNVVMLDSDLHYLKDIGADPSWIRGVIGMAGPYDFLPLTDPKLIEIFGGDRVKATQPITYIDGKRAPMLLAYGTDDTTVSPKNAINMAAKLRSFGSDVELKAYPGVGHIGLVLSLAPGFRGNTTLRDDVTNFVMAH
ncbi:MAG TPA: alpha/beta hydrolase [Rhizomicrobium sp.]